jgi:hypothetical protein
MRWLFSLAALMIRWNQAESTELLVLRHENAVLRRNAGRTRYKPADRAWFAVLTRFIPRRRWAEVSPPVVRAEASALHRKGDPGSPGLAVVTIREAGTLARRPV